MKRALILSGIYWDDAIQRHHQFVKYLHESGYNIFFIEHIISSKFSIKKIIEKVFKKIHSECHNERYNNLQIINMKYVNPGKNLFRIVNEFKNKKLLNKIGKEFDLIINYLPINTTNFILDNTASKTVIYDCVRNFSGWGGYYKDISLQEDYLISKADKIFTDSFFLTESIKAKTSKSVIQFLPIANKDWLQGCEQSVVPTSIKNIAYFGSLGTHIDLDVFRVLSKKGYNIHFWGQKPLVHDFDFYYHGSLNDLNELAKDIIQISDAVVLPYIGNMDGVIPAKLAQSISTKKPVYISKFYDSIQLSQYLYLYHNIEDLIERFESYSSKDYNEKLVNIKVLLGGLNEDSQYKKFIESIS